MEQSVDEINASEKKVKPALKRTPLHGSGNDTPTTPGRKKKALKWDEEAIEEHDQLRGTRMKIEEPNTPFTHYDSGAESDGSHPKSPIQNPNAINWDQLHVRLADVAANCPSSPSSHGDYSDDEKKRRFREYRKKHYNEMELVKRFRIEHPDGGDDDDDNDADDDMDML